MTTALVTGFGAYAGEPDNPSQALVQRLDGQVVDGVRIVGRVLAVSTTAVGPALRAALDEVRPDVVLATGVAPGRPAVSIERVAINVRDFPIEDVDGAQPVDLPVVADGPAAYLSTLPIKAVVAAWRKAGIPGFVSNTSGTYLCNQVFYLARRLTDGTAARAGFLHVPVVAHAATGWPPPPSQALDQVVEAVRVGVHVAATHAGPDVELIAGMTH